MKPTYILDTNIVSEQYKPFPDPNVMKKLRELDGRFAIASTTLCEMLSGAQTMPEGRRKNAIFSSIIDDIQGNYQILDYDTHCAWIQSDLQSRLYAIGKPIDFKDTQIASIAISNNLILVTRNKKHFLPIQEVSNVLFVENWFEEN